MSRISPRLPCPIIRNVEYLNVFKNWTYPATLAIILSLTVASGLVHGYLDGRWAAGSSAEATAQMLPQLPEQVGPWVRVSDHELDRSAQKLLQCYGYLNRQYWNPATGERVTVAVLFGPRGPIAVHTPEICYSSAGTVPVGDRVAESIESGGETDQLWHLQLAQSSDPAPILDVWYGWSDGGPWQAGKYPRVWLTDRLFKIQLAGPASAAGGGELPCRDFLHHFLPAVREVLERSLNTERG